MDRKSIPETEHGLSKEADEFCEGYKAFLTNKTEREVIDYVLPILADRGYKEYVRGAKLKAGAKFYKVNRGKTILMCTKGKRPVSEGVRVSVAHIDSPRLDFKPHPLFEDASMAFFKTHYYGGIKKYQWTTIPLSIRGVVYTKSGEKVTVKIGEGHDEPAFLITDLLPHLAQNQMKKGASEIVEGEQLNLLIGSIPYDDEMVKDRVKLAIMKILNDKYGITEDDFETAELCAVPAFHPRDMGLDRSMIAAYGQDDSSCAYAEFMAELDTKNPEYTTVTIFADKEETGSDGNTGLNSSYFKYFVSDLADCFGANYHTVLSNTKCLSADVNAAFDPSFPDVSEKMNASYLNHGVVITKYTGARGKGGTSDASAEYMGKIRALLDENDVVWQTGELGKVDAGGGGTVAMYLANLDIDVVDLGVPVLSMHAPFEVVSKLDVYMAYRAFKVFAEGK